MSGPGFTASASINTCRFVKMSGTLNVAESDANEISVGISQEGAEASPIPGASAVAATAGNPIKVHGIGEVCLLQLGSGGASAAGDLLKSDADGKGVEIAATGTTIQYAQAMALESGAENEKIRVIVLPPVPIRPALA